MVDLVALFDLPGAACDGFAIAGVGPLAGALESVSASAAMGSRLGMELLLADVGGKTSRLSAVEAVASVSADAAGSAAVTAGAICSGVLACGATGCSSLLGGRCPCTINTKLTNKVTTPKPRVTAQARDWVEAGALAGGGPLRAGRCVRRVDSRVDRIRTLWVSDPGVAPSSMPANKLGRPWSWLTVLLPQSNLVLCSSRRILRSQIGSGPTRSTGLQSIVTGSIVIVWVWLAFGFGAVALALAVFPHWRHAISARLTVQRDRAKQRRDQWTQATQHAGRQVASRTAQTASGWGQQARDQWRWILLTLVCLLVPATIAWWLSQHGGRDLDGFDDRIEPGNHQVAQLLQGEHLVPPPPLPPDVFTAAEVEMVRPMLSTADRRWDQMDDEFVQRLLLVFKIMRDEHGYDMALLEGYRSPERQNMLAAKGSHVTQAKAWQSYHQYGLAADCAFVRGGKLVISEKDAWAQRGYELYGQVAEQVGLTWGGRWQMMDLGHVEWRRPGARAKGR